MITAQLADFLQAFRHLVVCTPKWLVDVRWSFCSDVLYEDVKT